MKYIPIAVSFRVARTALHLKKHSPTIMFGTGVVSAVGATVLACKATLKLEETVERREEQTRVLTQLHKDQPQAYPLRTFQNEARAVKILLARDVAKLYAPAAAVGAVSIALLTGAHVVLKQRNVALAAAYTAVDRAFNEYRSRVRKELGDQKDREFRYGVIDKEVVEETENGHEVVTVKRQGLGDRRLSQYAVVFDQLNPSWQKRADYNATWLWMQQTYANQRLQAKGSLLLNDVYDALGMDRTPEGGVVGWVINGKNKNGELVGDGFVDFGMFDQESQEVIDFMRGDEGSIWLDFNVDGPVLELIGRKNS